MKDLVHAAYDFPTTGLAADLLGSALARVDWQEIVTSHEED